VREGRGGFRDERGLRPLTWLQQIPKAAMLPALGALFERPERACTVGIEHSRRDIVESLRDRHRQPRNGAPDYVVLSGVPLSHAEWERERG
jgi:hypothetical protein